MPSARLVLSAALLALLLGGTGAVAWWAAQSGEGDADEVSVLIVGPDGALWNGTVHAPHATALSALDAAARAAGLNVSTQRYPGMGTYVRAVGPYEAHGAVGWIYEVAGADGVWRAGDRSAAEYPLARGDALRWRWVDG